VTKRKPCELCKVGKSVWERRSKGGEHNVREKMGQNASSDGDAFSLASAASSESLVSAGSEKKMSPEAALREVQRVKMRIQAFRVRSGTEDICSNLYSSWKAEKK